MTVFGILGCTMLLVCGFAIKNTVDSLPERQYGEVSQYDLLAVTSADDLPAAHADLASDELVTAIQDVYVDNVTVQSGQEKLTLQLFVVPDGESLDGMVSLTSKDGSQEVSLTDEGMLLSASAAQVLGVEDANGVQVRTSSLAEGDVTIAHVVAGYLGDAAYMSQAAYESVFGSVEPNAMLATLAGNATRQIDFADVLARDDTYLSVTSTEKLRQDFSSAFTLINGVVYVVIVLAAGLAFIVLFTLSTTNISERQRELATLKVLGFRQKEVRHVREPRDDPAHRDWHRAGPAGWPSAQQQLQRAAQAAGHLLCHVREPVDLRHRNRHHPGVRAGREPRHEPHARRHQHGGGAQESRVGATPEVPLACCLQADAIPSAAARRRESGRAAALRIGRSVVAPPVRVRTPPAILSAFMVIVQYML